MGLIGKWVKEYKTSSKKHAEINKKAKEYEQKEYYKAKEKYAMSEAKKRATARAKQPSGFSALLSGFAPGKTSKGRLGKPVDLNASLFGGGGILGGSGKGKKYRGISPRDLI